MATLGFQMLGLATPVAAGAVEVSAEVTSPPKLALAIDDGKSGSSYVGFNSSAVSPNPQDLTAAGATDWRIWGRTTTSLSGDDRKSGGSGISDLTNVDPAPSIALRALGPLALGVGTGASTTPFSFTWANGTTAASVATTKAGLQHNNNADSKAPGYGFSFTVPTSISPQRLTLWASAHHGTGTLTATIGTTTVADASVAGGQNHGGVYTLDFSGSGTVGETLTVSYVLSSAVPTSTLDSDGLASSESNVVVYAAALAPQLVQNGSFEDPENTSGGAAIYPNGLTDLSFWSPWGAEVSTWGAEVSMSPEPVS